MEIVASVEAPCPPARVFQEIVDLERYPRWMKLVHRAEVVDSVADRAAWDVELRTRLGPLNRSKRLRMERTEIEIDRLVVFERAETDGRNHAAWILRAEVTDHSSSDTELTRLVMTLTYHGSLFTSTALRAVLDREINEARLRLVDLVAPTR